ncbi:PRKR-interacting protein 1 homolog [Stomoxys calcitrans]|uniref:PRKR-interacting protein 1 homolog n=1 Tax=Stomoxys calcitrans TaxID=35570 RepID=UPI0027E2C5B2|nr:PRKR-interacting protein 1 homolog [Stomoxys calcitrans]
MSLIKNLVKEPEKKDNENDEEKKPRAIIKSAIDLQRLKLEKLMKNPEKPVVIPDQRKEKDYMQSVPSFVRNVMGSSAGAGSGEFHVYRHLRRKEYARQKMIQHKSVQEQLDDEYQQKIEENRRLAEEKTAKKRAKRLKKKQKAKKSRQQKSLPDSAKATEDDSSSDSNDDNEDNDQLPEAKPQSCSKVISSDILENKELKNSNNTNDEQEHASAKDVSSEKSKEESSET